MSRPQNQYIKYIMPSIIVHKILSIYILFKKYIYIVSNRGSSTEASEGAVGYRTFFIKLVSNFAFDILQIPSGSMQICSGYIAPTYTSLAMGLVQTCTILVF